MVAIYSYFAFLAIVSIGHGDLWVFLALTAFLGVAYRGVGLDARTVLGASLLLILLGILLKGHQPNNIACSLRRKDRFLVLGSFARDAVDASDGGTQRE